MNVAVRYDSKTGNTKKLAEAIAKELGTVALTVQEPLLEKADILFLGSAVYAAGVSAEVKAFIASLTPGQAGKVACFSTAALLPSTYKQVKKLLEARGVTVMDKEFHCRGQFHFAHKGKPDASDLAAAAAFAREVTGGKA